MKKFLMTTVYLFIGLIFLGGFSTANASWAEVADAVLKEAQELKKLENEYFNKRKRGSVLWLLNQFPLEN